MPQVEHVSKDAIILGRNVNRGVNTILIQITDKGSSFPKPKHTFREVHQFDFHDLDHLTGCLDEAIIEDEQADKIAELLAYAKENELNIVAHCHAGISRSGAIAEVCETLGFDIISETARLANVLVKQKLYDRLDIEYDSMKELKERYDAAAKMYAEGKFYF